MKFAQVLLKAIIIAAAAILAASFVDVTHLKHNIHHEIVVEQNKEFQVEYIREAKEVRLFIGDITWETLPIMKKALEGVPRDSRMVLHITSRGGFTQATRDIIEMMNDWEGETVAVVDRYAFSGGAMIFISADRQFIANDAKLLFHLSGLVTPNGKRCVVPLDEKNQKWMVTTLDMKMGRYISSEEVYTLLDGHDVIISGYAYNYRLGTTDKFKPNEHILLKTYWKWLLEERELDAGCKI
jgi:hypothetical protein